MKKALKIIMWVFISIVLIFILVALLIQIPAIQTRIVQYATSYISDKTNTKVEIEKVSIAFPKSVVIESLYMEDLNRDTLLYAGRTKVNIAFSDLLKDKITVNSFSFKDVNINLHNAEADSVFNYNFLLTAFGDTTVKVEPDTVAASAWTFSLKEVNMENIRLRYNDQFGGMDVKASLQNLELDMEDLDLEESIYSIDNLLVENLTTSVLMDESHYAKDTTESESVLPKIIAQTIEIRDSKVSYADSVGKQTITAVINDFKLKEATVDLQKEMVSVNNVSLAKSEVEYYTTDIELTPDSVAEEAVEEVTEPESNWEVSVNKITLDDNSLIYQMGKKQAANTAFNTDYLEYRQLTLHANNLAYSPEKTSISITEFHAIDQNDFAINSFKTDFSMDEHSIVASNTQLRTANSVMDADFSVGFESMEALTDSMKFKDLNLDMRNVQVANSDILYFNPELIQQPYFKNRNGITTLKGKVTGTMEELKGTGLVVKAAGNTSLSTDFLIRGMPDYMTAWYHFPNLKVVSNERDIMMMAGPYIPDSMSVPRNISLKAAFKGRIKNFESTLNMTSSFGDANVVASIDPQEHFNTRMTIAGFDVGRLMNDTVMYGPLSMTAEADGKGLDMNTITGNIKAEVSEIYLNKYTYHNLHMDGAVSGRQFEGTVSLDDENAVFDFDGLVNMNPDQEQYKFKLNVEGIDLKKLNLTEDDVQLSFISTADMKGGTFDKMNGKAGITNIIVAKNGTKYQLDSLLSATVNETDRSEINVSSALIDIDYKGTLSPIALPSLLNQFVNNYFPFSDSIEQPKNNKPSDFEFEIQVHNHPILSKVLVPELTEFEPGVIRGSFDSEKQDLKLNAEMRKIVYGTTEINDFAVEVDSKDNSLNYKVSSKSVGNTSFNLDNFILDGKLREGILSANVSSTEGTNRKLLMRTEITKNKDIYKLTLDPSEFYLVNNRWDVAEDNSIEFGNEGFRIHHFFISHDQSQLNIASVNNKFNDDLSVDIKAFQLGDLSRIIEKDTSLVKGHMDGNVLLKRVGETYGLVSDIKISDLVVRKVPIGNLTVKADNPTGDNFDINVNLSGHDNNLSVTGNFTPGENTSSFNINTDIESLSMKTIEAFSMEQITEAEGILKGNFLVEGTTEAPGVIGNLTFKNVFMNPTYLNNRLEIKDETIEIRNDGIYFDTFTMADADQHTAVIDGSVQMKQFSDFVFALQVNTTDFLLLNTTAKENQNFFGRMIIDSNIEVSGPMELPRINARVKMKEGSNFTFSVPEDQLTTDKGEDVVVFLNPVELSPILSRSDSTAEQSSGMMGFDLASIIEIDKGATLRLLMDPASADSLVVKGEAALSFAMDPSGKMSLTGTYNLNEGSYLVSFESIIKRQFDIETGSTITWNGDPLDAIISINAIYTVRTSPVDLMGGNDEAGNYNEHYPFLVLLKLRGEILKPEISFEIQLPEDQKGKINREVIDRLSMLNEDESALNKQVFALLVLGRFIQEDPFDSGAGGGTSAMIRSTVSKFLSAQLNQLSSKMLPGTEIKFDIQSYEEGAGSSGQGRTDVEFGVKQQLFNERMSVEIGGSVNVEGEGDQRSQNRASEIAGDVTVEYKMTKDGRFRAKAFRLNQYEALEGQIIETGLGVVYVKDFNRWNRLFKGKRNRNDSFNLQNTNETSDTK